MTDNRAQVIDTPIRVTTEDNTTYYPLMVIVSTFIQREEGQVTFEKTFEPLPYSIFLQITTINQNGKQSKRAMRPVEAHLQKFSLDPNDPVTSGHDVDVLCKHLHCRSNTKLLFALRRVNETPRLAYPQRES